MKSLVGAFNQEKALVGAFFVITNLRLELFQALAETEQPSTGGRSAARPRLTTLSRAELHLAQLVVVLVRR